MSHSSTTTRSTKSARSPLRLPRTLLLWWSLWLLASWTMSFGWRAPVVPGPRVYEFNVRNLLVLVTLGLIIVWPIFRLSTPPRRNPLLVVFLDYLAIMSTLQVVVWPMRLSGQWLAARIISLDLQLAAWGLLVSAVIALALCINAGRRARRVRSHTRGGVTFSDTDDRALSRSSLITRMAAMLSCVMITMAGPILFLLLGATSLPFLPAADEFLSWSPIAMAWEMSQNTLQAPTVDDWIRCLVVTAGAIAIWSGAVMQSLADRRLANSDESDKPTNS